MVIPENFKEKYSGSWLKVGLTPLCVLFDPLWRREVFSRREMEPTYLLDLHKGLDRFAAVYLR